MSNTCAVCHITATQRCSKCHMTYYCGKEHQRTNWKQHKLQCMTYKVSFSRQLGYHLVALCDIPKNQVLIKEDPVVVGPEMKTKPICLGCGCKLKGSYRCSGCGWPLCSSKCETSTNHVRECQLMKDSHYKATFEVNNEKEEPLYCAIATIRCLMFKNHNLLAFEQIVKLRSNFDGRKNTQSYKDFKANIVEFCREVFGINEDSKEILTTVGIMDSNSIKIEFPEQDVKLRGLYPTAAMLTHNCQPNTKCTFLRETYTITVVAKVDIKAGEVLSTTFTKTMWPTMIRRKHLKETKGFECKCKRCADSTEFGTYLGSMYCPRCKEHRKNSYIVSINPLDEEAPWQCETCTRTMTPHQIIMHNKVIQREIACLDLAKGPKTLESFLERCSEQLHPTNEHVLVVKSIISHMYGNLLRCTNKDLSDAEFERKRQLSMELFEVMRILDPGLSDACGLLLFDIQMTTIALVESYSQNNILTRAMFEAEIEKQRKFLEDASEVFAYDSDTLKSMEEDFTIVASRLETRD